MGALDNQEIQDELFEELLESKIGEMGGVEVAPNIPVNAIKLDKIKLKDDDPKFVVVEVESGISGNRRNWRPEILRKVVDDCNKKNPGGHLGHPFLLDPKTYDAGFPKPQVIWLGAAYEDKGGGKAVAKFKGYVLKGSDAREYLELGLIDGVSFFGDSKMRPSRDGYDVTEFTLETIDFARQGRQGMKSRVVALTGEQMRGGSSVEAKDIAALSEDEIRTHAPLLVKEIERKAVEPVQEKIGEQVAAVDALTPQAELLDKIKDALKLSEGENPLEKVSALMEKIEEMSSSAVKEFIKSLVGKKAKTERQQQLVARLIGEMHSEYEGPLDDALKTKIEAEFDAKVEGDEDIKAVIGEMQGGSDNDHHGSGAQLGGRSRFGVEHGRGDAAKGVVKDNQNITVRKRRVA